MFTLISGIPEPVVKTRLRIIITCFDDLLNNIKIKPDGCWIWLRDRNKHLYGRCTYKGKRFLAHRLSWILFHTLEDLDENIWVLHKCDNPSCINPAHLFEGNQLSNMQDCFSKKRMAHQKKRICKNGHLWTAENYYETVLKSGKIQRACKVCESNRKKLEYQQKKGNL